MPTTITCGVMRGVGRGIRASINNHVFIECGILRGVGRGVDARIGSGTTVLSVDEWTPDQGDEGVPHGHTVQINVSAANTAEHEELYDEGSDFLTGTLTDVTVVGDELNLSQTPYTEDWEGASPLSNWTQRFTTGTFTIIDDGSGSNKVLKGQVYNNQGCRTADDGPNAADVEVRSRYQFKQTGYGLCGLVGRVFGSGTACRGYECMVTYSSASVTIRKIVGDGNASTINSANLGISHAINTWYWLAFKISSNSFYAKWWADGGSEPGSWTLVANDSTHTGAGDTGVFFDADTTSPIYWWDDFEATAVPATYVTSGNWESGDLDVSATQHHSASVISWDETTPTNTTVAVKAKWRDSDSWSACTNGDTLPNIAYGQDMRAGATKDTLQLRVELATTDTSVTPSVSNLSAYFEPGRLEDFEIVVHGVSCVPADDLDVWGRAQVSGGSPTQGWGDLWARTRKRWMAYSGQVVTATFKYWGNTIESITFTTDEDHFRCGDGDAYYLIPEQAYEHGLTRFYWNCLEEWTQMGHAYEWHVTDTGIAIHADAYWICGHYKINDQPGFVITATPNITDNPGSMLAKAYRLDDHIGHALVQGYRFDDLPGSMLTGIQFFYDNPGSVLTGVYHLHDQPGMILVYGVNRDGAVFVNIIDDETYQTLVDEGITFG